MKKAPLIGVGDILQAFFRSRRTSSSIQRLERNETGDDKWKQELHFVTLNESLGLKVYNCSL